LNNSVKFLSILMLVLALVPLSQAAVIGANRGIIDFNNVLKNGYAQETVTLTTDTDFNLSVDYQVEGEIAEWVRFEPEKNPFFISRDEPYTITVIMEPPADAQIKRYSGSIRFITGALGGPDAQFGTAVRAAINLNLGLQVTGQEILSCSALEVAMDDVEEGYPFEWYAVIRNSGNVRITPEFVLEFWNQDQTKLVQTLRFRSDEQILPTAQKRLFKTLQNNLSVGQYWVKMQTPICGNAGNSFFTVSVLERGGVSDKGELLGIENSPDATVGQIIPIDAVFENKGSRYVSAKFKGTISSGSNDNIFKIIDTEELDVAPGETVRLRTYFNPTQEGQYFVTGRVLYNKKLTFDKSSVINVHPAGPNGSGKSITPIILILLIIAIIVILVLIILNKRKRK
jgi:hypothetical protein